MSTWISEISRVRARAARIVLLAAALPLTGCFGPDTGALSFLASGNEKTQVARDVLRKASLLGGDVVVRGPEGYCVDRRSLRREETSGFALLASCEALSGVRGQPVEPVLMTVSVLPGGPGTPRPGATEIAALMAPARVLAAFEDADLALVHFASGGDGVLPDGDARHWRGGMIVNGYLVGLALYAREGGVMAGGDGRRLLTELSRSIRRASPDRAAGGPAGASPARPAGSGRTGADLGGLFPESE